MQASMDINAQRRKRFLDAVLDGKRDFRNLNDAKLFLGAICDEQDRLECMARLCSQKIGLTATRQALLMDVSSDSLNGHIASLFLYFTSEGLRQFAGGRMLCDLLSAMLKPDLLWQAYSNAAVNNELEEDGICAFASLITELLILLPIASDFGSQLGLRRAARALIETQQLQRSKVLSTRQLAYQLEDAIRSSSLSDEPLSTVTYKAGGRHDNDFADFRRISIFPTRDELLADEAPYMLPADNVLRTEAKNRVAVHLGNQFRLLREDMLAELRDDLKNSLGANGSKRRGLRLRSMQFTGINCGQSPNLKSATVAVRCFDTIFRKLPKTEAERKKHLEDNKSLLKHGSFGCIMAASEVVAFATIERNEELLAKDPPILLLRLTDTGAMHRALTVFKLTRPHNVEFVAIDTPFFAYEPVLRCLQNMPSLPLAGDLLSMQAQDPASVSPFGLEWLADHIRASEGQDIGPVLGVRRTICLDRAQTESVCAGLTQRVSQIQGPPGTGKSFAGAILTKLFFENVTDTVILVLCYTNHALDQFLEDILGMEVDQSQVLRLGSKSTPRTEPMMLQNQSRTNSKESRAQWSARTYYRAEAESTAQVTVRMGADFSHWKQSDRDTLESLEFDECDEKYFHALSVPECEDGMNIAGTDGKAIDSAYLFSRWVQGKDAGIFKDQIEPHHSDVWQMTREERQKLCKRWMQNAVAERVDGLLAVVRGYDADHRKWENARGNRNVETMKTKRIIGCTTTAAAKYADQIALVKPGIVLVEEAGEVLESHILTALSRETKQLVMIGDHLQLRPKIKNYALTVERGDGFDLNRSLFERLIMGGHPHTVLTKQHRMRPQISALVRRLMYPELEDSEKACARPDVLGLQKNVIFINHSIPEVSDTRLRDRQDESSTSSRQNIFEVKMILKIVKYLAQQGYGTDKQVVLTPYLGQVRLIMDEMKEDHDPVLGDLDSHDLIKAGLLTPANNFQGEESDIVVASLTRSNDKGDIGFMNAPQRLNVLLSRARCGLILIGNADTFKRSKKGTALWTPFFEQLVKDGHFFDGLPVKCEQHPAITAELKSPEEFEHCPNGGCTRPCPIMLVCGKHRCPDKCHQLVDHSKVLCLEKIDVQCSRKHQSQRQCWQQADRCPICERDADLLQKRKQKQDEYLAKLIAIEDQISLQRDIVQDLDDANVRATTLKQKSEELAKATRATQLKKTARIKKDMQSQKEAQTQNARADKTRSGHSDTAPAVGTESQATKAWKVQKKEFLADNEHIDAIMGLIGLESVKRQVLAVKDKVDTSLRQGASLSKERFNVLLLGNPGTGKTTVARLYAKCLASMGVVAGEKVHESTASKLMTTGVTGYNQIVDEILNEGGGALFIDEAYQFTEGSSPSGRQVLDAIMDDAENLTGKVVFILAGYRKEMESLLAHNPGLRSRFPYEFEFADYEDDELRQILLLQLHSRFNGRMEIEAGHDGLLVRIVARRVGYGRGRPGFGNARAVENALAKMYSRQATRIAAARRAKEPFDDLMLTKYDMLGQEPGGALQSSKAWTKLQSLIGLGEVKKSIHALMQSLQYNYKRELQEEPLSQFNLNRVFLGSPGTGKTTVAKLYGEVLADLGLLSNGEVIVKNPSDFVGDVLGASEKTTKGILSATVGKVLVIDEAYGLYPSASGQSTDIYKTAVIDTLVAEVQSVPGDDRCVLLLGYRDEMETMLRNANPGLARRFPVSEAFHFQDFTDDELKQVIELKLKQQAYVASKDAMHCMMESLKRARNKLHFGNAGEVDILLNRAKQRHQQRCTESMLPHNNLLEASDVDVDFGKPTVEIAELFKDDVGHDSLVKRLEEIRNVVSRMRALELDPHEKVPYNYVFCGPPGTGKTTTARKMGKIYYDLGILATDEILEKSASDLVAPYVGQTGDRTKRVLESALGKVLLIDEAYRLASGEYGKEAVDELVDLLTKPQFARKIVVILAGYDHDIQRLLSINPGLTSRFPEKVSFDSLSPESCIKLLIRQLAKEKYLDVTNLHSLTVSGAAIAAFDELVSSGDWANARDVMSLADTISRSILQQSSDGAHDVRLRVGELHVMRAVESMTKERQRRAKLTLPDMNTAAPTHLSESFMLGGPSQQHRRSTNAAVPITTGRPLCATISDSVEAGAEYNSGVERDAGVSEEVWSALMADKQKALNAEQRYNHVVAECKDQEERDQQNQEEDSSSDDDRDVDPVVLAARLRREQERLRYAQLRREAEEMERQREHEKLMQKKLRKMGVCCMGFQWIKQAQGYRCAGGSHFVSDDALEAA